MQVRTTALAALVLVGTCAIAQSETAPPPVAALQLPADVAARLKDFVGTWSGGGTVTLQGQAHQVTGGTTCKLVAGDTAVMCAGSSTSPGLPKREQVSLIGYDPGGKTFWGASANNITGAAGGPTRQSGDAFIFDISGKTPDGKTISGSTTQTSKLGSGVLTETGSTAIDGKTDSSWSFTWKKQK